jgi:hypothetical protein
MPIRHSNVFDIIIGSLSRASLTNLHYLVARFRAAPTGNSKVSSLLKALRANTGRRIRMFLMVMISRQPRQFAEL